MNRFCSLPAFVASWVSLTLLPGVHGDPLNVAAGTTVQLGDPNQPMSHGYDSLTVEAGGTLEVQGDLTLTIAGDITINGRISANPTNKAVNGSPGQDGAAGPDNQPTGLNAGSGGILGEIGAGWTQGGAPRLTLTSQGTVLINGTIELHPEFEGGDGGRGGHGGNGGSGISGDSPGGGGFGGQAGSGHDGGHAGLPGANVRISGDRIELRPGAKIDLTNKGKGGKGGEGGNGGHGGKGGDGNRGAAGGGGGPAGGGGRGGLGGTGGILSLTADVIILEGGILLEGGPGGEGGAAGSPGHGGDAGASSGDNEPGPRGGDAGNVLGSGPRGGNGGPGGSGGTLTLLAREQLINRGVINVDGGNGGTNGTGRAAAIANGGKGGAGDPAGANGSDSGELLGGTVGADGPRGIISIRSLFQAGEDWQVSVPFECSGAFTDTDADLITRRGWELCDGDCIWRFLTVREDQPIELSFEYRFLTTEGTLEFSLGGRSIHTVQAPGTLRADFQRVTLLLTDPALRTPAFQEFRICLSPVAGGEARAQLAGAGLRNVADTNPPPEIVIEVAAGGSPVQLDWTSVAGQSYQVQSRASLGTGDWVNVGSPIAGTGGNLSVSIEPPPSQESAFYRILVAPLP